MRRGPATTPRTVLLALLAPLAAGSVLAACSSSGPPPRTQAEDAAATVAGTFQLGADAQTCLEDGFRDDADALSVVGTVSEPPTATQAALAEVLDACATVEQYASSVAAQIGAALPPSDTADQSTQVRCVADRIQALDDTERRALLVGLVALTAPPTGELALARNDVVNGLYEACGVTVG